jgi:hypothetical protein
MEDLFGDFASAKMGQKKTSQIRVPDRSGSDFVSPHPTAVEQ